MIRRPPRSTLLEGRRQRQMCIRDRIQIEEVEKKLQRILAAPFLITKSRSEKYGEQVALLTEDTDLDKVMGVCLATLPKYWVPRKYVHVDRIPLTDNGKPARKIAEQMVL